MPKPIRRNATSLSPQERNDFVNAILALKNKHYADGISYWDKQNQIHKATHVHSGIFFLPWHRELCNRFEVMLQEINPAVALHYWDFTTDPRKRSGPNFYPILNDNLESMYDGFLDNGNDAASTVFSNFTYDSLITGPGSYIYRDIDSWQYMPPIQQGRINDVLILNNFIDFFDPLERLHNDAHEYIGGTINEAGFHSSFCDPFVFLIHSNVDRIFAEWQIKKRKRTDPDNLYPGNLYPHPGTISLAPWDGSSSPQIAPWTSGSPDIIIKTYTDPSIIAPPIYDTMDLTNLMIRDFSGDTGNEASLPPNGVYWESPDIVVRPVDDVTAGNFDSIAGDVVMASRIEKGQDNYIYVRVKNIGINDTSGFMLNNGNNVARDVEVTVRITAWAGSQFVFPQDWTTNDPVHVLPLPVLSPGTFSQIPFNQSVIAKFKLTAQQAATIAAWGTFGWHPCLLAQVTAANDYDQLNSIPQTDNVAMRRNNLAQRNLTVVDILPAAQQQLEFTFVAGNLFNKEKEMRVVVDKSRLPASAKIALVHKPQLQTVLPGTMKNPFILNGTGKKTALPLINEKASIDKKETEFSFIKQAGKLYALTVRIGLPPINKRSQIPVHISQRNKKGNIVGGVSLLINITGKPKAATIVHLGDEK